MAVDGLERFPSARDIEKVARNPECQTLRTALAANIDLRKYAAEKVGLPEERQSRLAIARGNLVERVIFGKDAARLVERFVEDGRLDPGPTVVDLGSHRAKNRAGMAKAADRTDAFLGQLVRGNNVPEIIVHPVLGVSLGRDIQYLEPDALVRFRGSSTYEPVELKSYPYRAGRTDRNDLRQARRQAAVYVIALRGRIAALGGDAVSVPPQVTLVFTRPQSAFPAPIYSESVQGEIRDVELALRLLAVSRTEVLRRREVGEDIVDSLAGTPTHYVESCLSFCSLAKHCRQKACAAGDVHVLGDSAGRILDPARHVDRALALLDGARPGDEGERAMAERLRSLAGSVGSFPLAR